MSFIHKDAPEVEWAPFGEGYVSRSSPDDDWKEVAKKDVPKEVGDYFDALTTRKRLIEKYGLGRLSGSVSAKKL